MQAEVFVVVAVFPLFLRSDSSKGRTLSFKVQLPVRKETTPTKALHSLSMVPFLKGTDLKERTHTGYRETNSFL